MVKTRLQMGVYIIGICTFLFSTIGLIWNTAEYKSMIMNSLTNLKSDMVTQTQFQEFLRINDLKEANMLAKITDTQDSISEMKLNYSHRDGLVETKLQQLSSNLSEEDKKSEVLAEQLAQIKERQLALNDIQKRHQDDLIKITQDFPLLARRSEVDRNNTLIRNDLIRLQDYLTALSQQVYFLNGKMPVKMFGEQER